MALTSSRSSPSTDHSNGDILLDPRAVHRDTVAERHRVVLGLLECQRQDVLAFLARCMDFDRCRYGRAPLDRVVATEQQNRKDKAIRRERLRQVNERTGFTSPEMDLG